MSSLPSCTSSHIFATFNHSSRHQSTGKAAHIKHARTHILLLKYNTLKREEDYLLSDVHNWYCGFIHVPYRYIALAFSLSLSLCSCNNIRMIRSSFAFTVLQRTLEWLKVAKNASSLNRNPILFKSCKPSDLHLSTMHLCKQMHFLVSAELCVHETLTEVASTATDSCRGFPGVMGISSSSDRPLMKRL